MKNYVSIFFSLIFSILLLISCNSSSEDDKAKDKDSTQTTMIWDKPTDIPLVAPPFENIEIAFEEFRINTKNEQVIELPDGGKITVPANAFVNANNEVVDNVVLKYREFNSLAEIIASGISMFYDTAGVSYPFQTAGMFELQGFDKNGNPVTFAPDKMVNVEMVSNIAGDFNFYKMEEQNSEGWQYLHHLPSSDFEGFTASIEPIAKPYMPIKYDPKTDHVFQIQADLTKFPDLKLYRGLIWKYAGPAEGLEEAKTIISQTWYETDITMVNPDLMIFDLYLSRGGQTAKTIQITPVLSGENYENAMQIFKKREQEFNEAQERIRQFQNEEKFLRAAAINSFGIFNCDRIFRDENALMVQAKFNIEGNTNNRTRIFYVIKNQNVVISYYSASTYNIGINPENDNVFVAILPDNKIAIAKANEIRNMLSSGSITPTFNLHKVETSVSNVTDIASLL